MAIFSKNQNVRKAKTQAPRRSPLATYYRSDTNEAKTSPFSKKTPKRAVRKVIFGLLDIIVILLIAIGLGYSLMIKPDPKVVASGLSFHSLSDYQMAVAAQLRHLDNRNKITFNEQKLAAALIKQYPEISDVQVELPLFSERPTVRLSVSGASFFLNTQGSRYVIDSSGKAVVATGNLPILKGLSQIDDQSGFRTSAGSQVLSASSVAFINTLVAECHRAGVPVSSLALPPVPQEIVLKTKDQPYFVKFYLGGDALTQTGQFLAARHHFADTNQPPAQYLDVRVPGKLFFK